MPVSNDAELIDGNPGSVEAQTPGCRLESLSGDLDRFQCEDRFSLHFAEPAPERRVDPRARHSA